MSENLMQSRSYLPPRLELHMLVFSHFQLVLKHTHLEEDGTAGTVPGESGFEKEETEVEKFELKPKIQLSFNARSGKWLPAKSSVMPNSFSRRRIFSLKFVTPSESADRGRTVEGVIILASNNPLSKP